MRKILLAALALCTACIVLAGCSGNQGSAGAASAGNTTGLEPGTYTAKFETDSTMFAINAYYKDEATLEVTDKGATLHAVLRGKGIVKLHVGTAESAQKDGAQLLEPTETTVTFDDGYKKKCYAFDIPVAEIVKEFDCASLGEKGSWYNHKVKVTDVQRAEK